MSHHLIGALFAAAGVLTGALLIPALRDVRQRGDANLGFLLTFASGFLFYLAPALVNVQGDLRRAPDSFGNLTAYYPSWYDRVDAVDVALTGLVAVFVIVKAIGRRPIRIAAGPALAIALWAVAHLSAGFQGDSLITPRGFVLLLLLAAALVVPPGRGAVAGAATAGVVLAAASAVLAAFRYDVAFVVPCQAACGGLGFSGVLPNENLLGVALAVSIPFAYCGFRGAPSIALPLLLGAGAIATGSRAAIGGTIFILVALAFVRPRRGQQIPGWRQATALGCGVAAMLGSLWVAQHKWPPNALTGRPELWKVAWHYIGHSVWLGYGPQRWAALAAQSQIEVAGQHSSHNLWLDVLFNAGVIGAVLFVGMLAATVFCAGRAQPDALLILAVVFTLGIAEGTWTIGAFDLLTFALLGFLLAGAAAEPPCGWSAAPARRPAYRPRAVDQVPAQTW